MTPYTILGCMVLALTLRFMVSELIIKFLVLGVLVVVLELSLRFVCLRAEFHLPSLLPSFLHSLPAALLIKYVYSLMLTLFLLMLI